MLPIALAPKDFSASNYIAVNMKLNSKGSRSCAEVQTQFHAANWKFTQRYKNTQVALMSHYGSAASTTAGSHVCNGTQHKERHCNGWKSASPG